jgi:LmbE family N-acetylglucosaminyl deacetylase
MPTPSQPKAIAIGAHPDDIEFHMAGTLLLLKEAGYAIHYMTIASGNLGSAEYTAAETRRVRAREAREAAKVMGAHFHPALTDDLEILYGLALLRKLAALLRKVQPEIVLTHSPQDYMEDHTSTCRLAVSAAFARGMPNFRTKPNRPITDQELTVYHCMPHGLRDPLRRRVIPGAFVNTTPVHSRSR